MLFRIPIVSLTISLLLFLSARGQDQRLSIHVFSEYALQTIVISAFSGEYILLADKQTPHAMRPGSIHYFTIRNDSVNVRDLEGFVGTFHTINLLPKEEQSVLRVKPVFPTGPTRSYTGRFTLDLVFGRLHLVNELDMDTYLAGVVEAESGPNAHPEFYKAQVVICRTYAISHLDRHAGEGFHLCDAVHCQVYKGISTQNPAIPEAVRKTEGEVIVDNSRQMITAAFHSNCGGHTEASANAWLSGKPYLVAVQDPYCQNRINSRWEKKILLDDWRKYLRDNGFNAESLKHTKSLEFKQNHRRQFYTVGKDSLLLRQIRADWKLRSTYFSVAVSNMDVVLTGKGYGHGVGLCQEGAMQMAKLGYDFEEIIRFYYPGVRMVDFHELVSDKPSTRVANSNDR
jgi:stage II sporulation protein D